MVVLTVLVGLSFTLAAGCGGGGSDDNGGGVPGVWRALRVGDQWVYDLTGTEGGQAVAGTARADVGEITRGRATKGTYWRLRTPSRYVTGANSGERWVAFFTYDADGKFQLRGLNTDVGDFDETQTIYDVNNQDGLATRWNPAQVGTSQLDTLAFQTTITNHDTTSCNMVRQGSENVTAAGKTYACHKYSGYARTFEGQGFPGYTLNLTFWVLPEISGFPKIEASWTDNVLHEFRYVLKSLALGH